MNRHYQPLYGTLGYDIEPDGKSLYRPIELAY